MTNRYELAGYLSALNSLLSSIEVVSTKGVWLTEEYNRAWAQLKLTVQEDIDNEARSWDDSRGIHEARADRTRDLSEGGGADRVGAGEPPRLT